MDVHMGNYFRRATNVNVQMLDSTEAVWNAQSAPSAPKTESKGDAWDLGDIPQYGRRLEAPRGLRGPAKWRLQVQIDTLLGLNYPEKRQRFRELAQENVKRWQASAAKTPGQPEVRVLGGDWGDTTLELTREFGTTFAVLNMANAFVAGGGYVEGCPAQEENMFRRTDCHFFVNHEEFDQDRDRYYKEATDLISAKDRRVYLDTKEPRTCVRAGEDPAKPLTGYDWLPDTDIFPFFELRAAAVDLRMIRQFSRSECKKRVEAQLDTLIAEKVQHAVLSAFGCGAFMNPAEEVAACYLEALQPRIQHFRCIAFAIFNPGYGPDNFTPFKEVLQPLTRRNSQKL
eukprot:TRINITY_DN91266_c0_g1_i1.p1 TRINITY_DN91266_c0_g1~~TRINITY_DN91266_c0_g1_i1.p1  ORF type:complete len:354 (+),score=78.49 TRINITY_DN91266_c0_g1_i1:38-1063(+)